MESKKRHTGT